MEQVILVYVDLMGAPTKVGQLWWCPKREISGFSIAGKYLYYYQEVKPLETRGLSSMASCYNSAIPTKHI